MSLAEDNGPYGSLAFPDVPEGVSKGMGHGTMKAAKVSDNSWC